MKLTVFFIKLNLKLHKNSFSARADVSAMLSVGSLLIQTNSDLRMNTSFGSRKESHVILEKWIKAGFPVSRTSISNWWSNLSIFIGKKFYKEYLHRVE